jgi:hypothetical protein
MRILLPRFHFRKDSLPLHKGNFMEEGRVLGVDSSGVETDRYEMVERPNKKRRGCFEEVRRKADLPQVPHHRGCNS